MRTTRRAFVALLLVAGLGPAESALVVRDALSNRAGQPSVLQPGDVLLSATDAAGVSVPLERCSDWRRLEDEWLPVGRVTLHGRRGEQSTQWTLREADVVLAFDTRDAAPSDAVPCDVRAALNVNDQVAAAAVVAKLGTATVHANDRAHWLRDLAEHALAQSRAEDALRHVRDAVPVDAPPTLSTLPARLFEVRALRDLARQPEARALAEASRDFALTAAPKSLLPGKFVFFLAGLAAPDESLALMEEAATLHQAACGNCREAGDAWFQLGWKMLGLDRGRAGEMLAMGQRGILVLESVETTDTARRVLRFNQFSQMATNAGQPALGEEYARKSLALAQSRPGMDQDIANAYDSLASAIGYQGRNRQARGHSEASLRINQRIAPASADRAKHNLGLILVELGELDTAERMVADSLRWIIGAAPGSLDEARVRRSLARVHELQGDLDAALREVDAALDIERKLGASGELFANTLLVKGRVLVLAGRAAEAEPTLDQSLTAFRELFDGDCLCLGEGLLGVGWLDIALKRADDAATRFEQARAIYAKAVPGGSAHEGEALLGLGEAWLLRSRPKEARDALDRGIGLLERDAPDQATLAFALNARGRANASAGQPREAERDFCAAADVLQRAGRRVASDSLAQAVFRHRHADVFRDCIDATLRRGDERAALLRLEATRSRSFIDALASREVALPVRGEAERGVLARVDEAGRERQRIQRRLADIDVPASERRQLEAELRSLGEQRDAAMAELLRVAPEIAALEGESIDALPPLQKALPEGAVALEYSVGYDETLLFVLGRDTPVHVHRIAIGSGQLTARVASFRQAILRRDLAEIGKLRDEGAALFELLLAPARAQLDGATLLLVSPDGPLFDLPFAALWDARHLQYAGVHWPLAFSDSLTTWAHLHHRQQAARSTRRLAVADADTAALLAVPALPRADEIAALPPLPGARVEVQALQATAPALTDVLLGTEASEARVRADSSTPALLHFAVHALLDARNPLDSALVLGRTDAAPGADGLLHVGEVLEELDLAADLVVLSGCDTGRGEALQGEGLIGFTRAFEFAGADAVMASLWPVSDRPTADFMERFYRALGDGGGTARALQRAIADTTASSQPLALQDTRGVGGLAPRAATVAHPYVWAGFQLYGGAR